MRLIVYNYEEKLIGIERLKLLIPTRRITAIKLSSQECEIYLARTKFNVQRFFLNLTAMTQCVGTRFN